MSHYTQRNRKKNLDVVVKLLEANQEKDRFTLQSLVAFNLGCTIKKAEEYLNVVESLLSDTATENPERKDH